MKGKQKGANSINTNKGILPVWISHVLIQMILLHGLFCCSKIEWECNKGVYIVSISDSTEPRLWLHPEVCQMCF